MPVLIDIIGLINIEAEEHILGKPNNLSARTDRQFQPTDSSFQADFIGSALFQEGISEFTR